MSTLARYQPGCSNANASPTVGKDDCGIPIPSLVLFCVPWATYELLIRTFLFCVPSSRASFWTTYELLIRTFLFCSLVGSRASHWTTYEPLIRTFLFCVPSWITCVPLDHLRTSLHNVSLLPRWARTTVEYQSRRWCSHPRVWTDCEQP
jgi:hypothetical protein